MIRDLTQSYAVSMAVLAGILMTSVPLWACMPAARAYDRKYQQLRGEEDDEENETEQKESQKQQYQQLQEEEKLWLASYERLPLLTNKRESHYACP